MKKIDNVGERVRNLIAKGSVPSNLGAATRLVEEIVELALELGADSASIYDAVGNTLHKEANKTNVYPSRLFKPVIVPLDIKEELGDAMMNLCYCARMADVTLEEVEQEALNKIQLLEDLHEEGKISHKVSGKIYRIKE